MVMMVLVYGWFIDIMILLILDNEWSMYNGDENDDDDNNLIIMLNYDFLIYNY